MTNSGFRYPPEFEANAPGPLSEHEEALIRRATTLRRIVAFLCVVVVMVCVATSAVTVIAVRLSQRDNTALLEQTKKASTAARQGTKRIEDCTTPGRKCFDDGQKRAGELVGSINKVVILAAACASTISEKDPEAKIRATTACVVERLANKAPEAKVP